MQKKCHIVSHGYDGIGHRLHGLFSSMLLHNIGIYYFDGYAFLDQKNLFNPAGKCIIDKPYQTLMKEFMKEGVKKFIKYHSLEKIKYKKTIHVHEIYKIPKDFEKDILYSIDNAYYFDRINLTLPQKEQHIKNIEIVREFFYDNKFLPKRRLPGKSIVIHIRLGDSMGRNGMDTYFTKFTDLMDKLTEKYPDYSIHLHSDGEIDFLKKYNYKFYGREQKVLDIMSDFIYCDILVTGLSGLSLICGFIGKHQLLLVPDEEPHSLPKNGIRFSEFISK